MSIRPIPRPFFLALVAFAIVLAAFVVLTLVDSTGVRLVTTLAALGSTGFVLTLAARTMFAEEPERRMSISTLPCPEHLRVHMTERGFSHFPALPNQYGNADDISVSEASNAGYAGIWLGVAGMDDNGGRTTATANLTAETAWRLAEQLAILVADHYHGDQRPSLADTVLSVDLTRLNLPEGVNA